MILGVNTMMNAKITQFVKYFYIHLIFDKTYLHNTIILGFRLITDGENTTLKAVFLACLSMLGQMSFGAVID
jgi:hypothetical protein